MVLAQRSCSVRFSSCLPGESAGPSSSLDRTRVYRKLCSWRRFWSRTRGWSLYGNHRADWVRRRGCPLDLCNRSSLACSALPLLAGTPALDDPVLCPDLRGRNTQARSADRFGAGLQPSQQLPRDCLVILGSQCGFCGVLHQERRRPRVNDYSSAPSLRLIHNHAQRLVRFGTPLRPPIQTHQAHTGKDSDGCLSATIRDKSKVDSGIDRTAFRNRQQSQMPRCRLPPNLCLRRPPASHHLYW